MQHLTGNQLAMTSNEILKADLLDIVFDNRNKHYGAYVLRKYYNNRLGIGLGGMFGFVLIIVLIVSLNPQVREVISEAINRTDTVTLSVLPSPPPAIHPPRSNVRQINNSQFEIVNRPTTMPTQASIVGAVISNITVDGPVDETPSVIESRSGIEHAVIESIPTPPPAPTTAAEFPGGQQAWMNFLNKYLRTPDELEAGQKRNVIVRFSVGEDGSVTHFEIMQSGGSGFDNEVIRVLKKMPKWKPAVQNGKNVPVMFIQPVTFMAFEE
jgi:periplasmic protein TonB